MKQQLRLTGGDDWGNQIAPAALSSAPLAAKAASAVSRRSFLRTVGGLAATSLTGCAAGFSLRKCEITKDMPFPDLVDYLNRNTDQISSWRCNDATLKARGGPLLVPSLNAMIAIERPRRFRLQGTVLNSNVVDLGSNDERFWVWVKNDEDPAILTSRHDCLRAAQQQLPLPFEPDWLIEALGVIPLDPDEIEFEKHETDPKKCFFRRKRTAPDGSPVELVSMVDTCRGVIVSHTLSDRSRNMVAMARMSEHYRDGKNGPQLPHTVELSWPQAKLGLVLTMGHIDMNPESLSETQFEMPHMAGCPVYDIGGETQQASETGRTKV